MGSVVSAKEHNSVLVLTTKIQLIDGLFGFCEVCLVVVIKTS